jgi:hypothetical protein
MNKQSFTKINKITNKNISQNMDVVDLSIFLEDISQEEKYISHFCYDETNQSLYFFTINGNLFNIKL